MKNEKDFLTELGFLSFVTRLKRACDAMLHDGRRLYKKLEMDIEPNWYVVFRLLERHGELTVTEIAEKIRFAHPSVITIVNKMIKAGYVESSKCAMDSRKRLLVLTEKAEIELPRFEQVWSAGVSTLKKMLNDIDALELVGLLESRINERGFQERTWENLERQKAVDIVKFKNRYAKDFARLNYEWISEKYRIEEHDRKQLDNPNDHIIKTGGQIFFAKMDGEVIGTIALIYLDDETYELAKMAVTPKYRGFKTGDKLMWACIGYAKEKGIKNLILESNTRQIPAIKLYRKFGFKEIPLDSHTPYDRADIRMELKL